MRHDPAASERGRAGGVRGECPDHKPGGAGGPRVLIRSVGSQDGIGSTVWESRDRFVEEHGDLEVDLELPPRTTARRENLF